MGRRVAVCLQSFGTKLEPFLKRSLNLDTIHQTQAPDGMIGVYDVDGFYQPHLDSPPGEGIVSGLDRRPWSRKLTMSAYLNPGWRREDGGALRLWDSRSSGWLDVLPEAGTVVVLRAD